ncbi:hypothetical protein DM860_018241 [Cuscuta australis]|uniref:HhH-GPD domain-containing protein n=1 Tax=Cuscuta australis TaxID=267555 RepID=A0A328D9T6_9ASTE|nr:hypothetical protein DM860_018241 [Cuscuta australis]
MQDNEGSEAAAAMLEEEREVFRLRIASFISQMHPVLGNRRFSPWKGSVVDSVAGAFLAQNVSDVSSSSAFMSLVAKYPNADNGNKHMNHQSVLRKTEVKKLKKKGLKVKLLVRKTEKKGKSVSFRNNIRKMCAHDDQNLRCDDDDTTSNAIDWHTVCSEDVDEISEAINKRGMDKKLAERIKNCLKVLKKELGSIDLEWLRNVSSENAKKYLLSIYGLGLKSVECIRLLTLNHPAFPVDTNVGRILVRLGWVPIDSLPLDQPMHLLQKYPKVNSIHAYIWPLICTLDHSILYEVHNQLITFGKVFCTKVQPNCHACPMREECKHFASVSMSVPSSSNLICPVSQERGQVGQVHPQSSANSSIITEKMEQESVLYPILESTEIEIEDIGRDEIPTIKIDKALMEESNLDGSKAVIVPTLEGPSIPLPKLRNISRLRTEHEVYELPDAHPLAAKLGEREPDDQPYLLAIITTPDSSKTLEGGMEEDINTVQGTLMIPCKTANRGSFPLNGTFFQVNEVFADYESCKHPIGVPRVLICELPRKTLYCGTSISAIFRDMSTEGVKRCFLGGYVCLRGFNRKTRKTTPLPPKLHPPLSKAVKERLRRQTKKETRKEEEEEDEEK